MLFLDGQAVQVSTCDLMRHPDTYAGRLVAVRAFVRNRAPHGISLIDISDQKCLIDLGSLHAFKGDWEATELFGPVGAFAWHMTFTAVVRGTFEIVPIKQIGRGSVSYRINDAEVTRQGFGADRDPEGATYGLRLIGDELEQYTRRPATEPVVRLTWRGGEDSREEILRAVRIQPDHWIVQQVTRPRTGKAASADEIELSPILAKSLDDLLAKPGLSTESVFSPKGVVKDGADYLLEIKVKGTQTILHAGTPQGGVSGDIISLLMIAASSRPAASPASR